MTSRWLVAAALMRDFEIEWRSFSLALLNKGRPLPAFLDTPEGRARQQLSDRAMRLVQVALSEGDNDGAGRFYTEWGNRMFDAGHEPTSELMEEAAVAAGLGALLPADLDAPGVEAALSGSLAEALSLAGPDVGSPVLHVEGAERATSGPIVSPVPAAEDVGRLWDAVVVLQRMGCFYELKRGRSGPPAGRPS